MGNENICTFCLKVWFVNFPRAVLSTIAGIITGFWPSIPFVLAIFGITLLRLPFNFYCTFKVALTSVTFRPGLRILILLTLPIIHLLAPIIVLIGVAVAAPITYIVIMSALIYEWDVKEFCKPWAEGWKLVDKYWKSHLKLYREVLELHHETGIPQNWTGEIYGIPFGPIKLLAGIFLLFYGLIFVGSGVFLLLTLKFIPGFFKVMHLYWDLFYDHKCSHRIIFFPFYIMGLAMIFVAYPAAYILMILGGFLVAVYCPYAYVANDDFKAGIESGLEILQSADEFTSEICWKLRVYPCLKDYEHRRRAANTRVNQRNSEDVDIFWDLFADKCASVCRSMLEKEWMTPDNVASADPSVILAVPAIAALNILTYSIEKAGVKDKTSIFWTEERVCDSSSRPKYDNMVNLLWPKIMKMRDYLRKNKKQLTENNENLDLMIADICSGQQDLPEKLKIYLDAKEMSEMNKVLKEMLIDLSLCLSRMAPMTQRMSKVFAVTDLEAPCDDEIV